MPAVFSQVGAALHPCRPMLCHSLGPSCKAFAAYCEPDIPKPAPKGLELPTIERLLQCQHGAPRRRVACQARGAHAGTNDGTAARFHLARHGNGWCVGVASSVVTSGASQGLASTRPLTSRTPRIQASHIGWRVASIPFSERFHPPGPSQAEPIASTHATHRSDPAGCSSPSHAVANA